MHRTIAAVIGGNAVPTQAPDNLFGGAKTACADKRDLGDSVAAGPKATSGPNASPGIVPNGGYPNSGQDLGTPSVTRVLVGPRSGHVG